MLDEKPKSTSATHLADACAVTADDLEAGAECAGWVFCPTPELCEIDGGLDHVAAGTGLRNLGAGTIELTGAPPGSVAVGAWLYWGLIVGVDTDDVEPATVVLDGLALAGEPLGSVPGPCWSEPPVPGEQPPEFRAYRAPVTDLLRPGINGEYRVEVPISSTTDGRDPWRGEPAPPPWVDGVSLVVLYAHPDVPRQASFHLHEGPALLVGDLELWHVLPSTNPQTPADSVLRLTRVGADGQRHAGHVPTYPFQSWLDWDLPGDGDTCTDILPLQVSGPGSEIDPWADWKGADGGPITQLWDTQLFEIPWAEDISGCAGYRITYSTLEIIPGGELETEANIGFYYDCVVVVAHALTVR